MRVNDDQASELYETFGNRTEGRPIWITEVSKRMLVHGVPGSAVYVYDRPICAIQARTELGECWLDRLQTLLTAVELAGLTGCREDAAAALAVAAREGAILSDDFKH